MALYFKNELKNGAVLAVWEITESEEELMEVIGKYREELEEELEEIALIKSQQHRREKLAVIALVNILFGEAMHIGHHENGGPYLENNSTHISITHTNKFAAVILHPTEDVGIDIESVTRDFSAVEKRALSKQELNALIENKENSPERALERNIQLAIYWCAKEALYKRMGRYNVDFSEAMEVEQFCVRQEGEIDITFKYPKNEHIVDEYGQEQNESEAFEAQYKVFKGHVIVWLVA